MKDLIVIMILTIVIISTLKGSITPIFSLFVKDR